MVCTQALYRQVERVPAFPKKLHRYGVAPENLRSAQQGLLCHPLRRLFRPRFIICYKITHHKEEGANGCHMLHPKISFRQKKADLNIKIKSAFF